MLPFFSVYVHDMQAPTLWVLMLTRYLTVSILLCLCLPVYRRPCVLILFVNIFVTLSLSIGAPCIYTFPLPPSALPLPSSLFSSPPTLYLCTRFTVTLFCFVVFLCCCPGRLGPFLRGHEIDPIGPHGGGRTNHGRALPKDRDVRESGRVRCPWGADRVCPTGETTLTLI